MSDESLMHDLECNHRAVNRPGPSIYSRARDEINRLRKHNKRIADQTREEAWAEISRLQSELAASNAGGTRTLP